MASPGTLTPPVDADAAAVPGQFSLHWWATARQKKAGFVPPVATSNTVGHFGQTVHDYT